MPKEYLFQVTPQIANNATELKAFVSKKEHISLPDIQHISVLKRSIDARQKNIKFNLKVAVYTSGEKLDTSTPTLPSYQNVSNSQDVIVVGAGPAGLFAALRLIELGLKPIVIEQGKDIRARRRDLKLLNVNHLVNQTSNYCFGEGRSEERR